MVIHKETVKSWLFRRASSVRVKRGRAFILLLALILAVVSFWSGYWTRAVQEKSRSLDEVRQVALRATVLIKSVGRIIDDETPWGEGHGTGFVKVENGHDYIITNYHVVSSGELFVRFSTEKKYYKLKLLGSDELFDFAVLELAEDGPRSPGGVTLGDSTTPLSGDPLYLWGNALGLGFMWSEGKLMGYPITPLEGLSHIRFAVIDMTCNPGNSGGAVFNKEGRVVAVVQAIKGPRPVCLAIPMRILQTLWPKLMAGGKVQHGVLGIVLSNAWEITGTQPRQDLALGEHEIGVVVDEVVTGSPAEKAGVKKGDTLLDFGETMESLHTPIADVAEFVEQLNLRFFLGDEVAVRFRRGHDYMARKMKLIDPAQLKPLAPDSPDDPHDMFSPMPHQRFFL